MKFNLFFLGFFSFFLNFSQEFVSDSITKLYKISGDSIFRESIELDLIELLPKRTFTNKEQINKYLILRRKTLKVYPYSLMASNKLDSLYLELDQINTKRKRKRYTKKVQKFLEQEFTDELSKLTQTEGQILIKLIYRNTGETAYDLVKKLRNGIKAFFYNTTAKFFNMNLKREFLPYENIEDYFIEDIIQRSIRDNTIDYIEPFKKYSLFELKNFWKTNN